MTQTSPTLPSSASIVVVGGGAVGTSIAYHLAQSGHSDTLLLERGSLTSGTTWHAAGLVMQLRTTRTMTEICRYGVDLFSKLKSKTGHDTGFRQTGSLPIARTPDRLHEIGRLASLGKVFGIDAHMLSPAEVKEHYPLLDESKVLGGAIIPSDGQINPVDLTMAYAAGTRQAGAQIAEGVNVTGFEVTRGRISAVKTDCGTIQCDQVVLAGGLWTRELAANVGVNVPLYAAEHMYVTTEASEDIPKNLPVLRDTDGHNYIKEEAGKLLIGAFEPHAKALPTSALPENQQFIELPEDWDQFELPMTCAMEMVPMIESLGVRHFMNGPESFTPDNRFILGEAPEMSGMFIATGFNSQGILASAGVGRTIAHWMTTGRPDLDVSEIDIARFHKFEGNERYLKARIPESLGLLYQMHWPHRQFETARGVRETPLHARLRDKNAVFGTAAGWERANWFARKQDRVEYEYSFARQNWFDAVGEECHAVRNTVGLFDLSSFGKTLIQGADACAQLNRIVAADMDRPVGTVIYTQMLNPAGGIESDLTITRLAQNRFLAVTAAAQQARDTAWLTRHIDATAHVTLSDVTAGFGCLALMGPNARHVLSQLTDCDLSDEAFPFGTAQKISVGYGQAWALRISYVGEHGWELYPTTDMVGPIFDALFEAGQGAGLRLAGYHALDSLRQEKGYRHWGHDITPADTPLEAGLGFAISKEKTDFIGCGAITEQRQTGLKRRLVHIKLDNSEPILLHDEPIFCDQKVVGSVSSGAFSYTLGVSLGQGYVDCADTDWYETLAAGTIEVEIAGTKFPATLSRRPFF
ncbi:FAD-dependent oxidoreductase [Rhodobacteraceae bacterium]|nr:FAD-dependent oxidoreductase [Paracoccaceae bacterium]